jgi:uncharacterized membrane protein
MLVKLDGVYIGGLLVALELESTSEPIQDDHLAARRAVSLAALAMLMCSALINVLFVQKFRISARKGML